MSAMRPTQTSSGADQFEAFFQRADLDRDGRISGSEAVAFFQGSNLPNNVLAQIWMYSDTRNTGFLGRAEFYNALKLVTVAQTGRELTKEIVTAALGQAAAKIPPPKINPVATAAPSMNTSSVARPQFTNVMPSQMGGMPSASFQNPGFRGTQPHEFPNTGATQQSFTPQSNQFIRPQQNPIPPTSLQMQSSTQGFTGGVSMGAPHLPGSNAPNLSTDWFSARGGAPPTGGITAISSKAVTPTPNQGGFGSLQFGPPPASVNPTPPLPSASVPPKPLQPQPTPVASADINSKALVPSGNGSFEPGFGSDVFSALQPRQDIVKTSNVSSGSSALTAAQHSVMPPVNSSSSIPAVQSGAGSSFQPTSSLVKQSSLDITASSTGSSGIGTSGANAVHSQTPWPKMTQSNIQKYTKVFHEVDRDRDGKITGEEARNLFLSWRLPREVLRQVWELSDQDSDSMLSLSEFCIALYLMERYREGRPLPPVLPNSVRFDDALIQATSQAPTAYGNIAWQTSPGFTQGIPGTRPMMPTASLQSAVPGRSRAMGGQMHIPQPNSNMLVSDKQHMNQLAPEEQDALDSKIDETRTTEEKTKELEKEIMDSKEKLEYYRTKMQDLVLYKSRCDNRLNEIGEKASADKREVELLAKKYEEKYKQVGEIASKLMVEEATFRDIQERKLELYNAMVKMEQGGSADGLLQVRADRIQSHLEELGKEFNDRCKKLELNVKPAAVIELPFGWQPGIQEAAVDWDEDWDKFEDEGFVLSKDLSVDAKNITAPPKSKVSSNVILGEDSSDVGYTDSSNDLFTNERTVDTESAFAHSEDLARSPLGSPGRSQSDSPTRESRSIQFDNHEDSPHDNDSQSESGAGSVSGWGSAFDASNDDMESIWGFDNKEFGHDKSVESSFFDSGGFGLDPIRTDSPSGSSVFGKESSPFFADSVPATPAFSSTSSPRYSYGQASFDSFRHSDSFGMQGASLARFDSMSSSADFDQSGFFNQRESLARFDSIRSTADSEGRGFHSFDDADPFGTGPFKSTVSETPKRGSSNWSAF